MRHPRQRIHRQPGLDDQARVIPHLQVEKGEEVEPEARISTSGQLDSEEIRVRPTLLDPVRQSHGNSHCSGLWCAAPAFLLCHVRMDLGTADRKSDHLYLCDHHDTLPGLVQALVLRTMTIQNLRPILCDFLRLGTNQ